jgi:predicted NBD/HSP70 family sugar kinase
MASSGIPRELYIFGILIIYGVFGFLFLALGNTISDVNNDCLNSECLPTYSSGITLKNSTGLVDWASDKAMEKTLNPETKNLFQWVKNGFSGMPEWVNWIFAILTAMLIFSLIIVILHG